MEWGSGGSTVLASWFALHLPSPDGQPRLRIRTVESSKYYMNDLRARFPLIIPQAEKLGLLEFIHGDIGETRDWGKPTNWEKRDPHLKQVQSLKYVSPVSGSCCVDLFLVDGRFREVWASAQRSKSMRRTITPLPMHEPELQCDRSFELRTIATSFI